MGQVKDHCTCLSASHASKILLRVILERMLACIGEIGHEQAGFRPDRGTRDQITNLRIILENAKERNQSLYRPASAWSTSPKLSTWYEMIKCGYSDAENRDLQVAGSNPGDSVTDWRVHPSARCSLALSGPSARSGRQTLAQRCVIAHYVCSVPGENG